jgi:hypothetical protein
MLDLELPGRRAKQAEQQLSGGLLEMPQPADTTSTAVATFEAARHDSDPVRQAVHMAWECGYQAAVDAIRELVREFKDDGARVAVAMLADTLESMKP